MSQARHEDIALRRLLKAEPDEGTYDAAHRVVSDLARLQGLVERYLEKAAALTQAGRDERIDERLAAEKRLRAELGRRVRE